MDTQGMRALALFCAFGVVAGAGRAETVALTPLRDATIYAGTTQPSQAGEIANGMGQYLFAGNTNIGFARRALVAFDVAGSVPPGATIDSVSLTMRLSRTRAGGETISLHRVTTDWNEGPTDPGGQEGTGDFPEEGDVTWLHTFYNTEFWTNPGGDFVAAASGSATVAGLGSYTWMSPGMVADVQAWLDDPASNFGWMVIGDEGSLQTAKRFDSRHAGEATRPMLVIENTAGSVCGADLDGDGVVGVSDLGALLGSWGAGPGPADLDGDGDVGPADLGALLGSWGPCPE
ncbi:MAG: DNRLRE domain-containing protein [Planctomycetota bacterium]|nr:DNRLRE domain-containing protein [Planctomycetota bacterium]